MAYYKTCPDCGAHLDPGETCGCALDDVKKKLMELTPHNLELLLAFMKGMEAAQMVMDKEKK